MPAAATPAAGAQREGLVVQTYVIPKREDLRSISHFEIHVAPDAAPNAPRTVLITRDLELYGRAASLEGTDAVVVAHWHFAQRAGKRCLVLDALEAAWPRA
jgi:hypothetical protein